MALQCPQVTRAFPYALLAIAALASACGVWPGGHPSDRKLLQTFKNHEDTFNALVRLSAEDSNVVRIAPDFTWLKTNVAWPRPDSQLGFSKARWKEYKAAFRKIGASQGLSRHTTVIYFIASTQGITFRGTSKGYAYSPGAPLSPLVESLDSPAIDSLISSKHGVAFKHIENDWYLFYDW